ncbi:MULTISPECIES: hypothetical protein [unclassified Microcoleus]|uniref:hypothetical protein n=1 Tax=unclassified Microcoleus TaxID=2642155 RepID=UPI002FD18826
MIKRPTYFWGVIRERESPLQLLIFLALSYPANTEMSAAESPFFPVKKPGLFGMQCATPDLFRLIVLWHELIESTVTALNSPDNRLALWQRNGAESAIDLEIQS